MNKRTRRSGLDLLATAEPMFFHPLADVGLDRRVKPVA